MHVYFWKKRKKQTQVQWLSRQFFLQNLFNDLTESNIQFHRWLVYEEYCKLQGSNCLQIQMYVLRHLNYTQGEFKAAFSRWIHSVFVVQLTVQMAKLDRLAKTYRKRICRRTENFATTKKLFERIQILHEWKFHRLIQL